TEEALDYLGPERRLVIVRELTKKFEEVIRGTTQELKELLQAKQLKGEIVVVVEGK
ncbi:MAG TPA: rRNA (cytidine-2'-O-)-methyltransferase, partial [Flavobacteriales bacterium]|nr:rRNA (cytidine-2'-O-)-methyltransferase [Flavobacteriales bacterium]